MKRNLSLLCDVSVIKLLAMRKDYIDRITLEPGKRSGKPCIRNMRITVYDVLGYLAAGMNYDEILADFPELEKEDILACLTYVSTPHHYIPAEK